MSLTLPGNGRRGPFLRPARRHSERLVRVLSALVILSATVGVAYPTSTAYAQSAEGGERYVVKDDDTLYSISRRHNVSVDAMVWANKLPDANVIREGQVLVIPKVNGKLHTVEEGETLWGLAQTYGASTGGILEANNLSADAGIVAGQRLLVPVPAQPAKAPERSEVAAVANAGAPPPTEVAAAAPSPPAAAETNRAPAPEPKPPAGGSAGVPRLAWPIALSAPRIVITQGYQPGHRGLDISAPRGTPIKAAAAGVVKSVEEGASAYGWKLVIDHGDGVSTWYAHLSAFSVAEGDRVQAGQVVGAVGTSGVATGPHLHFELRLNNTPTDPRQLLQ